MSDPLFHDLALQLIDPPEASRQALAAARTAPPELDPRLGQVIVASRGWLYEMLAEPWRPPAEAELLPFRDEAGQADVLRAAWEVGSLRFEAAQTRHLVSVAVRGLEERGHDPPALIATGFVMLLTGRGPDRVHLMEVGKVGARTVGHQDLEVITVQTPGWASWLEAVRWWVDDTSAGILAVKLPGGPTQASISGGAEENRAWFPPPAP